jgi:hypothetical protein
VGDAFGFLITIARHGAPAGNEYGTQRHPEVPLRSGTFDPEEAYGRFPDGMPARPESLRARSERKRGIPVPAIPCRFLVVSGSDYPEARGRTVAEHYGADHLAFPHLGHFDLVRDGEVRRAVCEWLADEGRPCNG